MEGAGGPTLFQLPTLLIILRIKLHGHGDEVHEVEEYYFGLLGELHILQLKKEEIEAAKLAEEETINAIGRENK